MPKVDASRNYYADLQVTPTSSADDVKKQYRKLAMQWHPDRNRGREEEASKKFQVIQAAFEILTDPSLKRQYDEARNKASGRFPTSSGVRGNPWANAGSNFAPPPKRSGATSGTSAGTQPRPASGAARYSDWGTRTQRASNTSQKNDPASAKAHYDAWTNMKSNTGASAQRKPPPTPGRAPTSAARESRTADSEGIPRTASQRQKAQASFGNSSRRTGYTPRSPGLGDEPPVTNNNYFTTRTHTNIFPSESASSTRHNRNHSAAPDPLAQFRENYMDGRNSAPYASPGGEKTSLFGDGLNRTRSTRESARNSAQEDEDPAFPFPRQRSSSTPRSSSNEGGSEDSTRANTGTRSDGAKASSTSNNGSSTKFGERYRPKSAESVRATTEKTDQQPNGSGTNFGTNNAGTQPSGGSTKYDTSNSTATAKRFCSTPLQHSAKSKRTTTAARAASWLYRNGASSEATNTDPLSLSPFEQVLQNDVADLIRKKQASEFGISLDSIPEDGNALTGLSRLHSEKRNNTDSRDSFGFGTDPATPAKRFASSSADNISTKFADENPEAWAFTAGGPPAEDTPLPSKLRSQSGSRLGRRSPSKVNGRPVPPIPGVTARRPVPPVPDSEFGQANNGGSTDIPTTGFSAAQWGEKIGSEHFIPQPNASATASPAKRSNSRKNSKPVKATQGGSAGIVDEDDEIPVPVAGWQESSSSPSGAQSPMAMDIDTPPMEKGQDTLKRSQAAGARKIPVEPTRPEWRAGNVDASAPNQPERPTLSTDSASIGAAQSKSAPSTAAPFVGQSGGSEDSEEFRATFADFKKVEPFTDPQPTGLHSFADLKTTLPFESRASSQVPLENKVQSVPPLDFPTAPIAPRLHPTMVVPGLRPNNNLWRKYTQDFYNYMEKWEVFNDKVLTHFATRQAEMTKRRQQVGRAWLDSVQGVDGAHVYQAELEQDHDVRKQWMRACDEHQARVREFVTLKDRAK